MEKIDQKTLQPLKNWHAKARRLPALAFVKDLKKKHPKSDLYLVGGFVRDLLLKRESKDIDFVVTGVAKNKLVEVLRRHGSVSFVGRTFGVFKFVPKGKHGSDAIDIALPRIDLPKGKSGAYRDVKVVSKSSLPIEEDLARRDFTVNALAWSLHRGELVDAHGGLKDLKAKKLRTVGEADRRFREDFSRMLRGLRFACQLDFSIETKTWASLRKNIHHLLDKRKGADLVPREVLAKEMLKAFYENPVQAFDLYDRSGALALLIPETQAMKTCPQPKPYHMEGTVWQHTKLALERLSSPAFRKHFPERPDAMLIMTVLFHDIGKPPTLKTPQRDGADRIRFDGHDVVGARIARETAEKLKLSSPPSDSPLHVDSDGLSWLIALHLLLLHDRAKEMKLTTIERYFVTHPLSQKLQQLILADSLATIPKSGRPYMKHLITLWEILGRIQRHGSRPPAPILKGDEVMETLKIASGPDIGFLLRRLREAQLHREVKNKKDAKTFIKKEYAEIVARRS